MPYYGPFRVPRYPKLAFGQPQTGAGPFDSGPIMGDAAGLHIWQAQLLQEGTTAMTGYSATIYGTLDPAVKNDDGTLNLNYPGPGLTAGGLAGNWFVLDAPSQQAGAGTVNNPLTAATQVMVSKTAVLAIWVHVTASAQTGNFNLAVWAID